MTEGSRRLDMDLSNLASEGEDEHANINQQDNDENAEGIDQIESARLRKSLLKKLNLARDCAYNVENTNALREALVYADKIYYHLHQNFVQRVTASPFAQAQKNKRLKVTNIK